MTQLDDDEKECPQCGSIMIAVHDLHGNGFTCTEIECDGYTEWDEEE